MDDTTKPVETANPVAPSNNATPSAAPTANVDTAEVERLRKEAEQAKMRANQLENELKKKAEEEEAARQKQLEEQNEWKQIAEQERLKREQLEKDREEAEARQQLESTRNTILGTFSSEVQEEAKALGITLNSTDETAQADFRAKLERLSSKVSANATPSANNPTPRTITDADLLMRVRSGDSQAREQAIGNLQAVKTMREMSGYPQNQ